MCTASYAYVLQHVHCRGKVYGRHMHGQNMHGRYMYGSCRNIYGGHMCGRDTMACVQYGAHDDVSTTMLTPPPCHAYIVVEVQNGLS
jgi:hypothetical protein